MGNCIPNKNKRKVKNNVENNINQKKGKPIKFNPINENDAPLTKDYQLLKDLGIGSYGKVVEAFHIPSGETRAIKVINTKNLEREDKLQILHEINTLSKLDHPNIIKIYEYFITSKNIYIVMEKIDGGELFERIVANKNFSEKKAAQMMREILSAVQFCHNNNIAHRDIKPENILVEGEIIKIIDFGTSGKIEKGKLMTVSHGTPFYIAPEVLDGEYNEKCDIWSCGVILYILLSGEPPFPGNSNAEIFSKVRSAKYDIQKNLSRISSEGKDLIKKMLNKNIKKRYTAQECLKHQWFEKNLSKYTKEVNIKVIDNLKTFTYKNKLQEAIYKFFVNSIATKEEKRVKVFFLY